MVWVLQHDVVVVVDVVVSVVVGAVVVVVLIVVVEDTPSGVPLPACASETLLERTPRPRNGLLID